MPPEIFRDVWKFGWPQAGIWQSEGWLGYLVRPTNFHSRTPTLPSCSFFVNLVSFLVIYCSFISPGVNCFWGTLGINIFCKMYIGFVIGFVFTCFLVENDQVWVIFTLSIGILGKKLGKQCGMRVILCLMRYDWFRVLFLKWLATLLSFILGQC